MPAGFRTRRNLHGACKRPYSAAQTHRRPNEPTGLRNGIVWCDLSTALRMAWAAYRIMVASWVAAVSFWRGSNRT